MRIFLLPAILLSALLTLSTASAQFDYPGFASTAGLATVRDAERVGTSMRLSRSFPYSLGSVWHVDKQNVAGGFVTEFQFRITDTAGTTDENGGGGGDGFAFVIQNDEPTPIGADGGGIGYSGIGNSLAIEFDTWNNPGVNDPDNNHVSVHTREGTFNTSEHSASIGATSDIRELSDGGVHTAIIEYVPGLLRIYLDRCNPPILEVAVDLEKRLLLDNGRAWVGFTSSTGSAWEQHDILLWNFKPTGIRPLDTTDACLRDSVVLVGPPGFKEYFWSTGQRTSSITVKKGGRYTLQLPFSACSRIYTEVSYTVLPKPDPRVIVTGPLPFCQGGSIALSLSGKYASILWSTGERTPTITVDRPGVYSAMVTDSNGCSGESDRLVVTVLPAPKPIISPAGLIELCPGQRRTLDAGEGFDNYLWSTGARTRTIEVDGEGEYSVTVQYENGCTATSDPVSVTIRTSLAPKLNPSGTVTLCPGDSVELDAGGEYETYRWSNNQTARTIRVTAAGSYWVDVTAAGGCFGRSDTVRVITGETPYPTITPSGSVTICHGESVTLTAADGYLAYRWSNGDTTRETRIEMGGVYFVDVTDINGCTGRSSITAVNVREAPKPVITSEGDPSLCGAREVTLTAPEGFIAYLWSTRETTRSITTTVPGSYTVTVTDAAGCSGTSPAFEVRAGSPPDPDAGPDTTICVGGEARLRVSGGIRYEWRPAAGLSCTDCADPAASPRGATDYIVRAYSADGCFAEDTVTVSVVPSATVRVAIPRDLRAAPGSKLPIPLILPQPADGAGIESYTIDLTYDAGVLRLNDLSPAGTLTSGWTIETIERSPGRLILSLRAPQGKPLSGSGRLMVIESEVFLGTALESDILLEVSASGSGCVEVVAESGHVLVDSICGLNLRLIESTTSGYTLDANRPNPFNPSTEIPFSIGLDAHTRLQILDGRGRAVATLVDEPLTHGSYTVTWNAEGFPSGLYYYRLTSGHWSRTGVMTLVK